MELREKFISDNMGLVHSLARRFRYKGIEYDDLFQAGCMGLVKAADNFDETRGLKFSTYAVPVILGEMKRLFREGGTVKIGRTLKELSLKAMRENERCLKEEGRSLHINELSQILGVDIQTAAQAISAMQPTVSLTKEDDGNLNEDIPVMSYEENISEKLALFEVMDKLSKDDKELLILRYFKMKTQTQTAKELGMTQVQVSRREKKILMFMRNELKEE